MVFCESTGSGGKSALSSSSTPEHRHLDSPITELNNRKIETHFFSSIWALQLPLEVHRNLKMQCLHRQHRINSPCYFPFLYRTSVNELNETKYEMKQ